MSRENNRFLLYMSVVTIYLAFTIFLIRYVISIPILYSLNDFFWFSSLVFLTAFLVQKKKYRSLLLFVIALIELGILCIEEYSQKFRDGFIYPVTYDKNDLIIYVVAFVLTLTFIYGYYGYKRIKN